METLEWPTRVVFGPDSLDLLKELTGKRVLVVTDSFLAKNGLVKPVLAALSGSEVTVFDQVSGEPTLETVAKGVVVLREAGAETVVAVGGGSAMDCAKGVVYCAGSALPIWCVPTTAGTGSEVTSFAVLTDPKTGLKTPVVDNRLLPQRAILDRQFLAGVPANVTADTGLDVLTHAAEALVSARASPFTDALAEKAFTLGFSHLPKAASGELEARGTLLLASTMAGMAFNQAGLGVCHGLSHALGGRLHVSHGRVNGILLPQVIGANSENRTAAKKYARLAKLCGLGESPRALSGAVKRLCQKLGLPDHLTGPVDLAKIAADALQDRCTADNPKTFTPVQLEALLREVVR